MTTPPFIDSMNTPPQSQSNEYEIIERNISSFLEKIYMGKYENDLLHIRVPIKKLLGINVYTEIVFQYDKESINLKVEFSIYTLYVYHLKKTSENKHRLYSLAVNEEDKDYYLLYSFSKSFDTNQLNTLVSDESKEDLSESTFSKENREMISSFSHSFVTELFAEIQKLRFSKCNNLFVKEDEYFDDYFNSTNEVMSSLPGYESLFQKCSVCFELTNYTTFCGHCICIPCLDKLENSKCPLCRVCLHCNRAVCPELL